MKKIYKYVLPVFAIASLISSCKKNLVETPYSSIFTSNFYKTPQDAEAALNSVYGALAVQYSLVGTLVSDWTNDQTYPRPVVGRETLTLFTYDPFFTAQRSAGRLYESPQELWTDCYKGIEKANWVIAKVPDISMDATRRTQIVAEAYFLRAFFHWTLTKAFGDVPIKTTPSQSLGEAVVGKSPKADVYKQIYSDLNQAIAGLTSLGFSATPKGRPSKEAAQALYAKAALYNQDWATALQFAQAVINSGKYALLPNVKDVYDVSKKDAARQENIWAFEGERTNVNAYSQICYLFGPPNSDGVEYGRSGTGSTFAYQSFFDSFNPVDKRRQLLDTTYLSTTGKIVHQANITPITTHAVLVKKYMDPNSVSSTFANNVPILRLADVYLIAAEAEARQNSASSLAYGYINTVRTRAGLANLPTGLSQTDFIDAVIQERSWELFAEGDRWYDLTRTDKFLTVIPKATSDLFPVRNVQTKHKYFPIPQEEINANPKITQNPLW